MEIYSQIDISSLLLNYLHFYNIKYDPKDEGEIIILISTLQYTINNNILQIFDLSKGLKKRYGHSIEDYHNDLRESN